MISIIGLRFWTLCISILCNFLFLLNLWVHIDPTKFKVANLSSIYWTQDSNIELLIAEKREDNVFVFDELNNASDVTKFSAIDSNDVNNENQKLIRLQDVIHCNDKSLKPQLIQRGEYWVLLNYVHMNSRVHCWETVTYTTHADFTFLDNVEPLLDRWRAPMSIALHAPGTDFSPTIKAIQYLRSCGSPLILQFVTFHIYFSNNHLPEYIPSSETVASEQYNCSLPPPWFKVVASETYKKQMKIVYPINLARNIAREAASTYYVFPSDIELYPSLNLPEKFLEMIRKNEETAFVKSNRKVFVLSVFEITEKSLPPKNKTILKQMLEAGTAIPFHKKVCPACHKIPNSVEWQNAPETEDLHVFNIGKRIGPYKNWEPFFISTNNEPIFDERLTWDGRKNKMAQGFVLCVMDYDFLILDNAFLVHRPGIKIFKKDPYRDSKTIETNIKTKTVIKPQLEILFGKRKVCTL